MTSGILVYIFAFSIAGSGHIVCLENWKTETEMMNKVAMGDLMIRLPQTKRECIPFVTTFKDLVRPPITLKFASFC